LETTVKLKLYAAAGGTMAAAAVAIGTTLGLGGASADQSAATATKTPIKHVVVLFDENESFDHYFGTYPHAANNDPGGADFTAKPGTPSVDGLSGTLLSANPNSQNPVRLSHAQAVTCSQNHAYAPEQKAIDNGLMDKFPENTAGGSCTTNIVMDYFDGNTVTGLWNLAQSFALNDNSFSSTYGPSTVGALNLISGQTHGATPTSIANTTENGTVIGDPDPSIALDDCATGTTTMSGRNVGDLLNDKGVSWGWFEGGFRPTAVTAGRAACGSRHNNVNGVQSNDYSPHHEPFEYYASTANQHHTAPASVDEIGHAGQANHQYDLTDFDAALAAGKLPAVSFLKAAQFEDAHPGNSDPVDEQRFIARTLDALEASPEWSSTAVVIAYDDSDGWYDHKPPYLINPSQAPSDGVTANGKCGTVTDPGAYSDRCGLGQRQPLLVVSPYAKQNFVDHTLTEQTSVLKFIEDNWSLGRIGDQSFDERAGTLDDMFDFAGGPVAPKVFLDQDSGVVTRTEAMPAVPPPATNAVTVTRTQTQTQTQTVQTPAPVVTPDPVAPTLSCKLTHKRNSRQVSVACTAKGGTAGGYVAVRLRLTHGGKQLATTASDIEKGKVGEKLTAKSAIKKGTYVVLVTVTPAGGAPKVIKKTLKVA
jgi:phospholipase C